MNQTRINKAERQIQKDLAEIFRAYTKPLFGGTMISVTVVRITPDFSIAKVYLSLFPSDKSKETFAIVQEHTKKIKHELAQKVRYQFRKMPELQFFIDDSLDYVERIDNLLANK